MNRVELKQKLDGLNVNPREYSLDGELNLDCLILYNSYSNWIVFYFDEKGRKLDEKIFESEDESCKWILKKFENLIEIRSKKESDINILSKKNSEIFYLQFR